MSNTKFDSRQIKDRSTLDQIVNSAGSQLDTILPNINSELTQPLRLKASSVPNLTVTIQNIEIDNPSTGGRRTIQPISDTIPAFTSGTVVFPATSGNNIVVTPGTNVLLTLAVGMYLKALISIDSNNNLFVDLGDPAASEALAPLPSPSGELSIGYVVLHNLAGTIQNISQNNIVQFSGGGSGSGSGFGQAVNFVVLDSQNRIKKVNNSNAEASIGDWTTYTDAADTQPVDMTGGSPAASVTISRTTTGGEILNGKASFKVIKAAANAQGQGISVVGNIPLAYQGLPATISFPFKYESGTWIEGDVKVFAYDVTNSQLLVPFNNNISGNGGLAICSVNIPSNCAQIRVGFHFASTSANAVTFLFDDFSVSPIEAIVGAAISDWQDYPLTIGATTTAPTKGTVVFDKASWRRIGDSMEIMYNFRQSAGGSAGSGVYLFPIPSGFTIDTTKLSVSTDGRFPNVGFGRVSDNTTIGAPTQFTCLAVAYDTFNLALVSQPTVNTLDFISPGNGSLSGEHSISYKAVVPIVGWSTNAAFSTASTFKISQILSSGTRVTSTPSKLGEYRTYIKNSSAITGTDNAPSQTGVSILSDGLHIYSVNYASAGTSGQPNRWEVFVGKNKVLNTEHYSSSGRTGWTNADLFYPNTLTFYGLHINYDPSSGVVVIDTMAMASTVTNRYTGVAFSANGGSVVDSTDGYFDISVSEKVIPVSLNSTRSELYLTNVSSYGSEASNKIFRFATLQSSSGSAITYVPDSVKGDSFLINEDGIYDLTLYSTFSASGTAGFSINIAASDTTTSIAALASINRMCPTVITPGTSTRNIVHFCGFISRNSVIRAHTNGNGIDAGSDVEQGIRLVKITD